jgi:hypothetical protein
METLLRDIMGDGSCRFAEFPQDVLWRAVRDHVAKLPGATLTGFVCDEVTEAWIDFQYRRHYFSINDQLGEYWFFVRDPSCSDEVLLEVVDHFRGLFSERGAE